MAQSAADAAVALVTGANRGIGLEVCRQLARRGYAVLLGSRDREKGVAAARAMDPAGGPLIPLQLDVTDPAGIERVRAEVEARFGRLDALVNNAAILYDTWQDVLTADLTQARQALETNTLAPWAMVRAFLPLLRRGAHPRVVNVSSEAGSIAGMGAETPAYNLSKAGLNAVTRMLADALRGDGILVNAVCPGWVATDMGGSGGRPVEDGAASVLWAVMLPDGGPTGGFFRDGRPLAW